MLTFEAHPGVTLMVIEVKVRRAIRERVERLDSECRCVKCEKVVLFPKRRKLGLCQKCYYRYREDRKEEPRGERDMFDAKLQRAGTLIGSRQGQRLDRRVA